MIVGKVVGTVISTRKNPNLIGNKFLIIEPIKQFKSEESKMIVAIDNVGAGVGEFVLVTLGSAARIGCNMENSAVDAAVVGIIDDERDIIISGK